MRKNNVYDRLYSKTVTGDVKVWFIDNITINCINIQYGALGGKLIKSKIITNTPDRESTKRWKLKYNKGYRTLKDINVVSTFNDEQLKTEILKCMPDIQLDENQVFKSMLCQKFKYDKFNYPALAQPKINGLRGTNRKDIVKGDPNDMFSIDTLNFTFRSREGKRFILTKLSNILKGVQSSIPSDINFDGELYIPEAPLNVIKSAIPYVNDHGTISKSNSNTDKIQYWIFDLAVPILSQLERTELLKDTCNKVLDAIVILPKAPYEAMAVAMHNLEWEAKQIFMITGTIVHSDEEFTKYKDECIKAGFEGAVIRDLEAEYAFGQRPRTMMKLKKFKHTECEIVDIIGEPVVGDTLYVDPATVKFLLRNDINTHTFECTPIASHKVRTSLYLNKYDYIGKTATVRFYERSGVKKVPFHANVEAWGREDVGDLNVNNLNKE